MIKLIYEDVFCAALSGLTANPENSKLSQDELVAKAFKIAQTAMFMSVEASNNFQKAKNDFHTKSYGVPSINQFGHGG